MNANFIKITPISTYDFDQFCNMCATQYGIRPLEYIVELDIKDPENPSCGNCGCIFDPLEKIGNYCRWCGVELVDPRN